MRLLTLSEYRPSPPIALTTEELRALKAVAPSISVEPSLSESDTYHLTPGSHVGVVNLTTVRLRIIPKIELQRVLFMLSYAMQRAAWPRIGFDFGEHRSIVEAVVPGFAYQVRTALERGPLYGYRYEEDTLSTIRGRVRVGDQLRRRYGMLPPVEVSFDEFTDDIEENRLLKAALARLGRIAVRSPSTRKALHQFDEALGGVSHVEYNPTRLPEITFTRLNTHYHSAIDLAKLIIRNTSFELSHGTVRASAFLVDMNTVFEDFLVVALREELGLSSHSFPQGAERRRLRLDAEEEIRLAPDLSWWERGKCVFVGDAKYKKVNAAGIEHPDIYQLLAYVVATDLPSGLLVYGAGEAEPTTRTVASLGRQLEVDVLNLTGSSDEILLEVRRIATRIRLMRERVA